MAKEAIRRRSWIMPPSEVLHIGLGRIRRPSASLIHGLGSRLPWTMLPGVIQWALRGSDTSQMSQRRIYSSKRMVTASGHSNSYSAVLTP
jgi:hypothetical protein